MTPLVCKLSSSRSVSASGLIHFALAGSHEPAAVSQEGFFLADCPIIT